MPDDQQPPAPDPTPSTPAAGRPTVVTVTGVESSDAQPVEMVEGSTGAKMPTGTHGRSLAMPDRSSDSAGGGIGAALVVVGVVVVLVVVVLAVVS